MSTNPAARTQQRTSKYSSKLTISTPQRALAWGLAGLGLVVALAGSLFGLYDRFSWFDEAIHTYNFFALTLLAAVYAYGVVLTGGRGHKVVLLLAVTLAGLGLGALWEIAEFGYDHFIVRPNAILPKFDTIVDMSLDTVGAFVAGLVLLRMVAK